MTVESIRKKWKVRRSNGLDLSALHRVAYNTGQEGVCSCHIC